MLTRLHPSHMPSSIPWALCKSTTLGVGLAGRLRFSCEEVLLVPRRLRTLDIDAEPRHVSSWIKEEEPHRHDRLVLFCIWLRVINRLLSHNHSYLFLLVKMNQSEGRYTVGSKGHRRDCGDDGWACAVLLGIEYLNNITTSTVNSTDNDSVTKLCWRLNFL